MWRLVGGIGVLLALVGLIVSVLGIAIFVSNFGNALLAAGAAGVSGGIVLVGISLVLKDLAGLAARLDTLSLSGGSAAPAASAQAFAPAPAPAFQPMLEEEEEEEVDTYAPPPPPPPPPVREPPPERTARPTLPPFVRPRPSEPSAEPAPAGDARRGRILGRLTEGDSLAARLRLPAEPPADAPPEPVVPAPLERAERAERPVPERQAPVPRPFAPPPPPPAPPAPPPVPVRRAEPPRPPEVAEPTILKSGIVGGMAYTLYSDGSIQAELPDGVLRFASLQELRDHVARAAQPR